MTDLVSLFFSAFIAATIAPGGSEILLAYLAQQNQHADALLLAVATLGNTLGAMTTWGLGQLAAKRYPSNTLSNKHQQRALRWLQHYGQWLLLFSWLPVVGDALCFVGGWLKLRYLPALLLMMTGKLARYALIIGLFA
jgi:membrane protein YqaA with SNARE-associated domain